MIACRFRFAGVFRFSVSVRRMARLAVLCWLVLSAGRTWGDANYVRRDSWAASMIATRDRVGERYGGDGARSAWRRDRAAISAELMRRFWEDFPETDWFLQDHPRGVRGGEDYDPYRDFGWYFAPDRDARDEQELIRAAAGELGAGAAVWHERLAQLVAADPPVGDPAWLALYEDVCRARRRQRLANLARDVPQFVFAKHALLGGSHYAYTEGQSDAQNERHFVPGAALCVARWDGDAYRVETLVHDPGGVIRDPDVSFDATRVVFAWKRDDLADDYHLYELDLATRGLRQLTHGLGVADYEPAYLPDGDIIFNSTRCVQIVDCWWTEVSNLYRCGPDGGDIRRLTYDQVHDNYPTVTEDGRVLYTRWEYNDRGQIYTQPLLQMNADGTGQREFYGGNSWFPTTILHARHIPGTHKVVAIATGHHSRQTGKLIVIDPALGRQENEGVQLVAPVRATQAVQIDAYGQGGELFQYPYPLGEREYLVTWHPVGWPWSHEPLGPRMGIYLMTADGHRERLVDDARLPCNRPVPIRPRSSTARQPLRADAQQDVGICLIQDVYVGPGLAGVPRGTVKSIRVVALDFRAAGIGENYNEGPGGAALISTPVAIGNGTWDPKIVLGDAPVHADGSAMFRVPARTPVYFQLLDQQGHMVQSMRSWTTLQGGEIASCVGCHESPNTTPRADRPLPLAHQAEPLSLEPLLEFEPPRGLSFPRDIQPILTQHCADCHDGGPDHPLDLTARQVVDRHAKRRWTRAYLTLTNATPLEMSPIGKWLGDPDHPLVNWISTQSAPPMLPPYSAGAARSRLIALLDAEHYGVRLSDPQRRILAAWIDLGVPFCGDYREAHAWTREEVELYDRYWNKRQQFAGEDSVTDPWHAGRGE